MINAAIGPPKPVKRLSNTLKCDNIPQVRSSSGVRGWGGTVGIAGAGGGEGGVGAAGPAGGMDFLSAIFYSPSGLFLMIIC
jgi:hypothetical protein